MFLSLLKTQSITPSDGRSPQRPCSAIWEHCQKECPSTGVTVCECVWMVVFSGHVAYWDNQIHSDSKWAKQRAILPSQFSYFQAVKESKDKECRQRKLHGAWRWREAELRKSRFYLPDKPAEYLSQKIKSNSATHRVLGHLYQLFWFSLQFPTYAQVDAKCYLRLEKVGGGWNASNALTICCAGVSTTVVAVTCTTMCKVKLSVWRLVKMSRQGSAGHQASILQIYTVNFIERAQGLKSMPHTELPLSKHSHI